MAGNGCGKTELGMNIVKALTTGIYPDWWCGRVFNRPTIGAIIKSSNQLLKAHIYDNLIGDEIGIRPNGKPAVIPRHLVHIPDGRKQPLDRDKNSMTIKWRNDDKLKSTILLRSDEQLTDRIMGYNLDWLWIDEEIKIDYYIQSLKRLRSDDLNFCFITATPEKGTTKLVEQYLYSEEKIYDATTKQTETCLYLVPEKTVHKSKAYMHASWSDNPTLSEGQKEMLRSNLTTEQLAIAEYGKPMIGVGLVYQIPEELYIKPPIPLSTKWRYVNGFDVGINDATAIVYIAYDQDKDIIYIFDVYKKNNLLPTEHVENLKRINKDLRVLHLIDPSANNRIIGETKKDMETVAKQYRTLGINIMLAKKMLKDLRYSTIAEFHERALSGRLVIFDTCKPLIDELRKYRRNEKNQIIAGQDDHAIDAMNYGLVGINYARTLSQYTIAPEYKTTIF